MRIGIKEYFKKIPKEIIYILQLFFLTRFFLTVIGFVSLNICDASRCNPAREYYSSYKILNAWGLWDTKWYINIAKNGYSIVKNLKGEANYGYFPLYPLFIKISSFIVQNYFVAALIVSNLFLILAAVFLYKLVKLDSDEETSLRTLKYLFIFSSSFILSAALAESLFLFLILACFYYTKKQKWLLSGVFGMFLTLTKPFGVLIFLPIIYKYIEARKINKGESFLKTMLDVSCILLIPVGLAIFAVYTYFLTGDIMAYPHIKRSAWENYLENPIKIIYSSLTSANPGYILAAATFILVFIFLIFFHKKIEFSYFLFGILIALFGISYHGATISIVRYYTAIFPIYIILGKISENKKIDINLMIILSLLQVFLMFFWTVQSGLIV